MSNGGAGRSTELFVFRERLTPADQTLYPYPIEQITITGQGESVLLSAVDQTGANLAVVSNHDFASQAATGYQYYLLQPRRASDQTYSSWAYPIPSGPLAGPITPLPPLVMDFAAQKMVFPSSLALVPEDSDTLVDVYRFSYQGTLSGFSISWLKLLQIFNLQNNTRLSLNQLLPGNIALSLKVESVTTGVQGYDQINNFRFFETDTDGEGLNDRWELTYGLDPGATHTNGSSVSDDLKDPEQDGVFNWEEELYNANPLKKDTDNDGMPDLYEINNFLDPVHDDSLHQVSPDADPDLDGLDNLFEYQLDTDPLNPDSDADGLFDGQEFNIGSNPKDPDSDDDTHNDFEEWVAGLSNVSADSDGDGISDADELALEGDTTRDCAGHDNVNGAASNPDTDGDGLLDGRTDGEDKNNNGVVDSGETDPCKLDTDGDTMSDGWETAYRGPETAPILDPLDPDDAAQDPDEDLLTNLQEYRLFAGTLLPGDTAQIIVNPNLQDTDGDGLSDGQEVVCSQGTCQLLSNPSQNDSDQDGLDDLYETLTHPCLDPLSRDTDQDGLPDQTEITLGTDPCDPDSDNDNLSDAMELQFGSDPNDPNTDSSVNDVYSDYEEFLAGTDPGNSLSRPSSSTIHPPIFVFTDMDGDGLENTDEITAGTYPYNLDSDFDGLPDGWEVQFMDGEICPLDPLTAQGCANDPDLDGLSDRAEFLHNTFPCLDDTDGDLMTDAWEIENGLDPLVGDAGLDPDNDGLSNLGELINSTDPQNPDSDLDGLSDYIEAIRDGSTVIPPTSSDTDPLDPDTDEDELLDGLEDADHDLVLDSGETDPLSPDTDSDQLPDGFEVYNTCLNPRSNDASGDPDYDDLTNLQELEHHTNPCDDDSDGDQLPDGDEINTYESNPLSTDTDHDGLSDYLETYTWNTDPTQPDSDFDGLGDGDELFTYNTDPLSDDSDADNLPDGWEVKYMDGSTCPLNPLSANTVALDLDGDGLSSLAESQNGTNPCNPDTDSDFWNDPAEINLGSNPLKDYFSPGNFVVLGTSDQLNTCTTPGASHSPSLVWTGSMYGVCYHDVCTGNEVYFRLVSSSGDLAGQLRITYNSAISEKCSLAWTGSEFGLSWQNGSFYKDIYFSVLDTDGYTVGSPLRVSKISSSDSINSSLAWTGSQYGIVWNEIGPQEMYFARIPSDGSTVLGGNSLISGFSDIAYNRPSLAWSGSEFGLAWGQDGYPGYFQRISPSGSLLASPLLISSENSFGLPLIKRGDQKYGLAYKDSQDGPSVGVIPSDGSTVLYHRQISSAVEYAFSIAWSEIGLGVCWKETVGGTDYLYFNLVHPGSTVQEPRITVTSQSIHNIQTSSLTWTGSEFAVAWEAHYLYLSRIGSNDPDGDGLNSTQEYAAGTSAADWDSDDDLMDDAWELDHHTSCGSNPLDPVTGDASEDADSDGVTNLQEYNYGQGRQLDPCDPDTDDDELPDGFEIEFEACLHPLDGETHTDFDQDGKSNLQEFQNQTDPCVYNSPGPQEIDSDHDGLTDQVEEIKGTNPNLADSDGDELPDLWELEHGFDPIDQAGATADQDQDGLNNLAEYAAGTNPHSQDSDLDGESDKWEVEAKAAELDYDPLIHTSGQCALELVDSDGDSVSNLMEAKLLSKPKDADSDDDAMGDWFEFVAGLEILVGDSLEDPDQDGRSNLQEFVNDGYFYTNPHNDDTDGDGIKDGAEGSGLSAFERAVERLTPEGEKLAWTAAPSQAEIVAGGSIKISGTYNPAQSYRLYLTDLNGMTYVLAAAVSQSGDTLSFNLSTGLDINNQPIPAGEMAGKVGEGEWFTPQASDAFTIRVQRYLNIHNGLHSPVLATDMSGAVVWRRAYEPFGKELDYDDPITVNYATISLTFLGREFDNDLGLYQLGARWYDPELGRFISTDPIPSSLNQYAYAGNNPFRNQDRSGLETGRYPYTTMPYEDATSCDQMTGGCAVPQSVIWAGENIALPMLSSLALVNDALYYLGQGAMQAANLPLDAASLVVGDELVDAAVINAMMMPAGPLDLGDPALALLSDYRAARIVRNPWGRRGSPAHQAKILEKQAEYKAEGWEVFSGGKEKERAVKIDGKNYFPDSIMTKGEDTMAFNVGKATKKGLPIAREERSIQKLKTSEKLTYVRFFSY